MNGGLVHRSWVRGETCEDTWDFCCQGREDGLQPKGIFVKLWLSIWLRCL